MPSGFAFANLAPGQYRVFWVKEIDKLEFRNAEVLRALRGAATVSVMAKGNDSVTLTEMAQ